MESAKNNNAADANKTAANSTEVELVKIVQYSYLIKYANTFMKIGDMIRTQGDGKTNISL